MRPSRQKRRLNNEFGKAHHDIACLRPMFPRIKCSLRRFWKTLFLPRQRYILTTDLKIETINNAETSFFIGISLTISLAFFSTCTPIPMENITPPHCYLPQLPRRFHPFHSFFHPPRLLLMPRQLRQRFSISNSLPPSLRRFQNGWRPWMIFPWP